MFVLAYLLTLALSAANDLTKEMYENAAGNGDIFGKFPSDFRTFGSFFFLHLDNNEMNLFSVLGRNLVRLIKSLANILENNICLLINSNN